MMLITAVATLCAIVSAVDDAACRGSCQHAQEEFFDDETSFVQVSSKSTEKRSHKVVVKQRAAAKHYPPQDEAASFLMQAIKQIPNEENEEFDQVQEDRRSNLARAEEEKPPPREQEEEEEERASVSHRVPRQESAEWAAGVELSSEEKSSAQSKLAAEEAAAADAVRAAAGQEELAEETLGKAAAIKRVAEKRLQTAVEEQALNAKIAAMKAEQKLKEIREATSDVQSQESMAEVRTGGHRHQLSHQAHAVKMPSRLAEASSEATNYLLTASGDGDKAKDGKTEDASVVKAMAPVGNGWWNPSRRMGGLANNLNGVMNRYLPPGVVEPFHSSYKDIYQGGGPGDGGMGVGGGGGEDGMKDFFTGMIGAVMLR